MPRCKIGSTLFDEIRGDVVVRETSDAPIPWPLARPSDANGRNSVVLCGDLKKAVKREANIAVQQAWGVSHTTVTKWRKTLGVRLPTEGDSRRLSANSIGGRCAQQA